MLQMVLSVASVVVPIALAAAGWARSIERRLDKLEQGQIGVSLQVSALASAGRRRAGEYEE